MISDVGTGLASGAIAGLGVAMPVGAIGTYLVGLGARAPRRVGNAAALGVASTDGLYAVVAVAGGAALQSALRPAATALHWSSVAALAVLAALTVWAGLRRYRAAAEQARSTNATPRAARAYFALLGLTALNPATLAYFTALVLGHQSRHTTSDTDRVAFVIGVVIASAAWQLLLVASGAALGHVAGGKRGQLAVAAISGAVMAGLALQLALS